MSESGQQAAQSNGKAIEQSVAGPCFVVLVLAVFVVLVGIMECSLRLVSHFTCWQCLQVDVQTPAVLSAKLTYLQDYKGPKIALIGDSLIYGSTMKAHGDPDWREHTLSRQMQSCLRQVPGLSDVLVMNLGFDGLLPAEMQKLGRIVDKIGAEAILFDVGIRSVSADFNGKESAYSRDWFRQLEWTPGNQMQWHVDEPPDLLHQGSAYLGSFLKNNSRVIQLIELLQAYWFEGKPSAFMVRQRGLLNEQINGFMGYKPGIIKISEAALVLMKAKGRYRTASFSADSVQARALDSMFSGGLGNTPVFAFYAKENPRKINRVLSPERLEKLRDELRVLVAKGRAANEAFRFIEGPGALSREYFLDLVHVNRDGYMIYADHILKEMARASLETGTPFWGALSQHQVSCSTL